MGMYTEIFVNVDLKPETPEDVIAVLRAMCGGEDRSPLEGRPGRWRFLFSDNSHYTPRTACAELKYCKIAGAWSLLGKGDIKNYAGEIEAFFDFIMPWVDGVPGQLIGYKRYEEYDVPELVFLGKT